MKVYKYTAIANTIRHIFRGPGSLFKHLIRKELFKALLKITR